MNLKPLTAMLAITVAALMTTPASGGPIDLLNMSAEGTNSSWTSDGAGTWTNGERYNNNECSYLETPVLPGTLAALGPLTFTYEFWIESFYDASAVLVSVDDGATWTAIESGLETRTSFSSHVANCMSSFGAAPTSVISGRGEGTAEIDLTSVAPTDLFQVRLVLATDYCCLYPGWDVSDIAIAGVALE